MGVIFNIIFIIIIILNRNTAYLKLFKYDYLTIIPRARMGFESIAQEWAINFRGHEGERNNCSSKIQLAGQKY